MRVEHLTAALAVALILGALTPCLHAAPSGYGQVETFQPGKKYNCVPASDGKGWDCKEIGKADATVDSAQSRAPEVKPVDAAPVRSTPSSTTPLERSARIDTSAETTASASSLPSYLTGASAAGTPRRSPAPATAPSPPVSAPAEPAKSKMHTATTPVTSTPPAQTPPARTEIAKPATDPAPAASVPQPSHATEPAPAPSALAPAPANPAPVATYADRASQYNFLALPGDHYVIELAHAERERELAATRDDAQVPSGKVYELHLRQNDADQWLLVWGDFDSIESARAARAKLLATATIEPGWPRRIAPLQAEVRRAQE